MANMLTTLEKQFERFIERPMLRLFGGRLEPADIAKYLNRAMEDGRQVFSGKLIGPNLYEVKLSEQDAAHFKSYESTLRQDLSDYLVDSAERSGITLLGRPEIRLIPAPELGRGDIQVQAQLVDRAGGGQRTQQFTIPHQVPDATPPEEIQAPAWLELRDRRVAIMQPFIKIGRSVGNDVILEADDVSREHAHIKLRSGNYVLTDMQSANGTRVNGTRVSGECVLHDRDEICIAAECMTFRLADRRGR